MTLPPECIPVRSRGYSVVELIFVCALAVILAGMAMLIGPGALARARTEGAASSLLAVLRTAREQAIAMRRNVRIELTAPDRVRVMRVEVPGPDLTVLQDFRIEQGGQFVRFAGVPDTPDLFSNGANAADFGNATALNFTSEGTFVDQTGDELNGTIFLGVPGQPATAQAVSLFGPTAYVRAWRWDGGRWVE